MGDNKPKPEDRLWDGNLGALTSSSPEKTFKSASPSPLFFCCQLRSHLELGAGCWGQARLP